MNNDKFVIYLALLNNVNLFAFGTQFSIDWGK